MTNAFNKCSWLGDGAKCKQRSQRVAIDLARHISGSEDCFQFRCEYQPSRCFGVEQWFDAELVAGQQQPLAPGTAAAVIDGKCENTAKARQESVTFKLVQRDQDFGIRCRSRPPS